jgi:hypothetical protein
MGAPATRPRHVLTLMEGAWAISAAEDGFARHELDRLPPLVKTHDEAVGAMQNFENLACRV